MDKANQPDGDEIECVDSETSKRYILNIKTGQVVREITDDKLHN